MYRKVLVLGGNGFIGRNLCTYLAKKGDAVFSFDCHIPATVDPKVEYIVGDFFDDGNLYRALEGKDVVFHAISTINPGNSEEFFFRGYSKDFIQSVKLISTMSANGGRLIFLSSGGTVYGNQAIQPVTEESTTNPINHYASLKLCIENVIRTFNASQKSKMIVARISNAYGPGQDYRSGVGFIDATIRKAVSGKELLVYGDGNNVRDYIYIEDIVESLYMLSHYEGRQEVFNISTCVGTSQTEIIDLVRRYYPKLRIKHMQRRISDVRTVVLDNSKLQSLGKTKFIGIEEGIDRHICHFVKMSQA